MNAVYYRNLLRSYQLFNSKKYKVSSGRMKNVVATTDGYIFSIQGIGKNDGKNNFVLTSVDN